METMAKALQELDSLLDKLAEETLADDAEVYACPLCRDTGFQLIGERARPCTCRRVARIAALRSAAGLSKRLQRMTFSSFDLRYYAVERADENGVSFRLIAENALQAAKRFAASVIAGEKPHGMLLKGEVGSGKTHLAAAIANELAEHEIDSLFLVVPEFLDQLRGSYRRENEGIDETELVRRAYQARVLVLDDMGAHNFTDWVKNKLFTIINFRYNHDLPCIITTNLDLDELDENIGDRATSRIVEACGTYTLYSDQDLRIANRPGRRV